MCLIPNKALTEVFKRSNAGKELVVKKEVGVFFIPETEEMSIWSQQFGYEYRVGDNVPSSEHQCKDKDHENCVSGKVLHAWNNSDDSFSVYSTRKSTSPNHKTIIYLKSAIPFSGMEQDLVAVAYASNVICSNDILQLGFSKLALKEETMSKLKTSVKLYLKPIEKPATYSFGLDTAVSEPKTEQKPVPSKKIGVLYKFFSR